MKKRICLILALILLMPVILLGYGLSLPSYYSETYYAELPELYAKLRSTEGRKIVIVGGSNVAFGVSSAELQETLRKYGYDYTVCNFGLYAAVGTSAMLSLSEDCLGEGDIVVLAIEPTSDTFSTYFGATAMLKCAEDNPAMLLHLSSGQRSNVVGNYISYLQERAEIRRRAILPQPDGAYAKASFDENGDMVFDRAGNAMTLGYDTAVPIDLTGLAYEAAFVEQVCNYIASAQKKGAQVVMSFSPMNRGALVDSSEETVYAFYRKLLDTFGCSIISNPNSYILDSGWFYDSNFHMNTAGMTVRTHLLASDLLTYLGCSKPIAFQMPEMPASIAQTQEPEADSGDFLFEAVGENGLAVSGLTEQGLRKQSLVVPASSGGKPVVSLTADALQSTVLTELTLPVSIEQIPDGAFAGCPSLRKLMLLHRDKTAQVSKGLLSGADHLTIYVPADAFHLYRDGAGCAANAWEEFLDRIVSY